MPWNSYHIFVRVQFQWKLINLFVENNEWTFFDKPNDNNFRNLRFPMNSAENSLKQLIENMLKKKESTFEMARVDDANSRLRNLLTERCGFIQELFTFAYGSQMFRFYKTKCFAYIFALRLGESINICIPKTRAAHNYFLRALNFK